MVLVPERTILASHTEHFFYFLIPIFPFPNHKKATICGKKIWYLIVITLFDLYAKKW